MGSARRWWMIPGCVLCVVALLYAFSSLWHLASLKDAAPLARAQSCNDSGRLIELQVEVDAPPWMVPSNSLNFPFPTDYARDNLRGDSHYITGFALAGFTNEFIAYVNMVYLGQTSRRIPIIPPFVPQSHISSNAGILPFSAVYNLTNLRDSLKSPILEWSDVKILSPNASVGQRVSRRSGEGVELSTVTVEPEPFGCWSLRQPSLNIPIRVPRAEKVLNVDISYTRVPKMAFMTDNPGDPNTKFPALAALIAPEYPHRDGQNLPLLEPSLLGSKLPPEGQLACFDFLYWMTSGFAGYEIERRWSLAWNTVGTHLTFTDSLVDITRGYLRRTLSFPEDSAIPPMITVHIRRGDFRTHCKSGAKPPCYAPLSRYRDLVQKLQKQIFETQNIHVSGVFVASDERDLNFWKEISSFGWAYFNHTTERTTEVLGEWYPILIDKVALSFGLSFVGTAGSTFSILNGRRVEDWNNGIAEYVDPMKG